MTDTLDPELQRCLKAMKECFGNLQHMAPLHLWAPVNSLCWQGEWFDAATVQALVDQGLAFYSVWQDSPKGRYPIQVSIGAAP